MSATNDALGTKIEGVRRIGRSGSGPVCVRPPKPKAGETQEQRDQQEKDRKKYVEESNKYIEKHGEFNEELGQNTVTRVSTAPKPPDVETDLLPGGNPNNRTLRELASDYASNERKVNAGSYPNGSIHAGHTPDTCWGGNPNPGFIPMDGRVNTAIGGQARGYDEGYQATAFKCCTEECFEGPDC